MNTGLTMVLEIPDREVVITFGINGFSITLPYQHFGRNTQGHCGKNIAIPIDILVICNI